MRKDLWCRNCGGEDTFPQNEIMFCKNCSSAYRKGAFDATDEFQKLHIQRLSDNLAQIWGVK